jgi:hypothetical protein
MTIINSTSVKPAPGPAVVSDLCDFRFRLIIGTPISFIYSAHPGSGLTYDRAAGAAAIRKTPADDRPTAWSTRPRS